MRPRPASTACLVAAGLSLVVGLFLWFDNPTVDIGARDFGDSGPAGEVGCSIAPWDAALNDNDDGPGGEHTRAYSDEVAAECYAASTTRFRAAVVSIVLAFLLVGVAGAVGRRSGRSRA